MNCPNCGAKPIKVNPVSGFHKWECGANEYGVSKRVFVNEVASCLRGQLKIANGLLDEIEKLDSKQYTEGLGWSIRRSDLVEILSRRKEVE